MKRSHVLLIVLQMTYLAKAMNTSGNQSQDELDKWLIRFAQLSGEQKRLLPLTHMKNLSQDQLKEEIKRFIETAENQSISKSGK